MFKSIGAQSIHALDLISIERPFSLRDRLEALKQSDFYNHDTQRWNERVGLGGETEDPKPLMEDQFLGLLLDHYLTPEHAEARYRVIEASFHAELQENLWTPGFRTRLKPELMGHQLGGELARVWALSLFDRPAALELFGTLKNDLSEVKDGGLRIWKDSSHFKTTHLHLLGAIVEGVFDRAVGAEQFEKLLESPMRDRIENEWEDSVFGNSPASNRRFSHDQLYGVIAEAMYTPGSVEQSWEVLRSSVYFNGRAGHWNSDTVAGDVFFNEHFYAQDQLLGVFAEHLIAEIRSRRADVSQSLPRPAPGRLSEPSDV